MADRGERTDEQLMEASAAGDLGAFETLLIRYERRILSYAYRLLGDFDLARDVYQQTFLNLFEKRQQYRQTAKFSTYVYCIAHNLCQNEVRRNVRRHTTRIERSGGSEEDSSTEWLADEHQPPPAEPLSREEEDRLVHEALDHLEPIYREVIALRIFQGMPFAQIAEITGVGENTVKSRMRYALGRLDKALRRQLYPKE